MKKIIIATLLLLLSGCSEIERKDYYNLSIDNYNFTVGFDDLDYLETTFKLDNNELKLLDKHFANVEFGIIDEKEVINYFRFYTKDFGSNYKIDDIELSKSIKNNCESFAGEYIDKKVKACIIQKQVGDHTNAIILSGDILNDYSDELSKIEIYIK